MMELEIVKKIPADIDLKELTRVLGEFYRDCEMYIDYDGFITYALGKFALATFLNSGNWDLWMATDGGKIKCFVLASVDVASNNQFCYFLHQAWVSKDIREGGTSRKWWPKIKARAKELFCKQMMIFSIRDFDAYNRFLGGGLKVYAQMLHMEV